MSLFRGKIMGTSYTVQVPGELSEETKAEYKAVIERELARVDEQMSTYREDSELMAWNRFTETTPFEVSPALFGVMETALDIGKRSGGALDITVGPVVNAWGFGPEGFEMEGVDPEHIANLLETVGLEKLQLDPQARTLTKERGDLFCDLSSIAKGYAVDRVTAALADLGVENSWVEVGGEVRCTGTNAFGRAWGVGIERPIPRPRIVKRLVSLDNAAIATSGDYRNYREVDGERYSHILDPRTGWPIRHRLASVSVIHPECMVADAFATALMVMGEEEGLALAEKEGLAAYFLSHEGDAFRESATSAFRKLTGMK